MMKKSVVLLWVLALGLPVLAGLEQDNQKGATRGFDFEGAME